MIIYHESTEEVMKTERRRPRCACDLGGIVFIRCKQGVFTGLIRKSLKSLSFLSPLLDIEFVTKRRKKSYKRNLKHHLKKYRVKTLTGINSVVIRKTRKQKATALVQRGYDVIIDNDPEIIHHVLIQVDQLGCKAPLIFLMNHDEDKLTRHIDIVGRVELVSNWEELTENEELLKLINVPKVPQRILAASAR